MTIQKHIVGSAALFLIVALFIPIKDHGQLQHPLIEYTTENGLSINSVNDMVFDKQGFLWITTADGLQRFDGYHFQTFKHNNGDPKSIAESSTAEIYEDENGNLWITHRTGIAFKPKGKNEFTELTGKMPPYVFRYPMSCVNETDSAVWVINYPAGIFAINKYSLQIKLISDFAGFSTTDALFPLSRIHKKGEMAWLRKGFDRRGDLYLVSDNGLKKFSNTNKLNVFFIIPDKNDSLVVITDKILFKSLANDPFTAVRILKYPFDATHFDNEYSTLPREIANNQHLLIGIKKIMLYDGNQGTVSVFPHDEYFSKDLLRYFHNATSDRYENSWLGYNGIGGIKVIARQKFNLTKRPVRNALPYTLTVDIQGKLYAGVYLGDIEVYDREGNFLKIIKLPEEDKKFGSPRAMAMIDSVTIIVKSTLDKLYVIDTRTGKLQDLSRLLPPDPDSASREFEMDMKFFQPGEVWVSFRNHIVSIVKNNNHFTSSIICTIPVNERINNFFYNKKGQIWIGTFASLWVLEKNNFAKIDMPISYIKHINQHADGKIWISTADGIYILKEKNIFKHLNTADGLPNSFVYSTLFDNEGNGWVSTNRGIAKIDPALRITTYSAKEGLQGDEFNTKGYCKGSDGTLYFAGVNGINFFKPENLVSKSGPSPTMLTEIEVNNQPYLPNLQPEFISKINLSYRQNNIRLSFSNMDFTVPEKNQYKFWLKGFQNDWTLPQTNNVVQYILPHGEYQLYVLGANYEGVWSKEPLVVTINILPPWYQTTYAMLIFLLLALGTVGAIFYFISKNRYQKKLRKLQMEQEVQKEKERLSRDLHDNLGSQITWLSNNITQLENAQEQKQPLEQKMNRLKEGSGELMQTLRETIWILNKDKVSGIDLFDKLVSHAA
ncbi:MAG: two-component regulator propeller domain-containing protein [Bacteroidota bacterium]